VFIILYADDILLVAPSVCELDNLFKICERELNLLDMAINYKKICLPRSHWTSHGCALCHFISGGARIVEQVGPAAGPKVVW